MINLTTACRRVATPFCSLLFAVAIGLSPSILTAQPASLFVTDSPLQVDDTVPQDSDESRFEQLPQSVPAPPGQRRGADGNSEDVDVLMRGPLHEAFATAHQSDPVPAPLIQEQPPEPIDEVPPEFKPVGNNVTWIGGYWAWDDANSNFIWISGVWRDVPPGRDWVPGYWHESDEGHRWISGFWTDETAQQQPELIQNLPPASIDQGPSTLAPGDNYFYVPGNWQYHGGSYRWLTGHWQPVVNNWIWIPASYVWTPHGCYYRSGYWDYEVAWRGTCYAPVHFRRPIYTAHHYRFRPSLVVNVNVDFLTHLFVRPGHCHYYYGDWYGSRFVNYGFRPWVAYGSHFRSYDPLLTYYRSQPSVFAPQINIVQYINQQHQFYVRNRNVRPRHTFAAQQDFINRSRNGRNRDLIERASLVSTHELVQQKREQLARQRRQQQQSANRNGQAGNRDRDVANRGHVTRQDLQERVQQARREAERNRRRGTAQNNRDKQIEMVRDILRDGQPKKPNRGVDQIAGNGGNDSAAQRRQQLARQQQLARDRLQQGRNPKQNDILGNRNRSESQLDQLRKLRETVHQLPKRPGETGTQTLDPIERVRQQRELLRQQQQQRNRAGDKTRAELLRQQQQLQRQQNQLKKRQQQVQQNQRDRQQPVNRGAAQRDLQQQLRKQLQQDQRKANQQLQQQQRLRNQQKNAQAESQRQLRQKQQQQARQRQQLQQRQQAAKQQAAQQKAAQQRAAQQKAAQQRAAQQKRQQQNAARRAADQQRRQQQAAARRAAQQRKQQQQAAQRRNQQQLKKQNGN